MQEIYVRFYVKFLDTDGKTTTVRLNGEKNLLDFVQLCAKRGFAMIDTHMAFYEVVLPAPPFGVQVDGIDHNDINLAKDGEQLLKEWLKDASITPNTA